MSRHTAPAGLGAQVGSATPWLKSTFVTLSRVQVVRQLPLHRASFRPVLIGFEHQHLSKGDQVAAADFLHGHGYAVIYDPQTFNTFALAMS